MEFTRVGTEQIALLAAGTILWVVVPLVIAILWVKKKKEKVTTVLFGALTFFVFAIVLEKPIQNVLIFPTAMKLPEHAVSQFINARPVLWAFLVGLFPGVFGEIVEQVRAAAPDQVDQVYAIADQLASFSAGDLVINIVERVFAVMYHIGASILVFYACKEKKHFFLYPLAIVGCGTFFGAYFLLYKKDTMITAEAKEVSA